MAWSRRLKLDAASRTGDCVVGAGAAFEPTPFPRLQHPPEEGTHPAPGLVPTKSAHGSMALGHPEASVPAGPPSVALTQTGLLMEAPTVREGTRTPGDIRNSIAGNHRLTTTCARVLAEHRSFPDDRGSLVIAAGQVDAHNGQEASNDANPVLLRSSRCHPRARGGLVRLRRHQRRDLG